MLAPDPALETPSTTAGTFDPADLPYAALEARVLALGGRPVHALRWFRALHRHGVADPAGVPELGRALTARLWAAVAHRPLRLEATRRAADATVKLRLGLHDGLAVESVLIPDGRRLTLCLSTQAGCAVGCGFCATGTMGLARNLTPGEIVGQYQHARAVAERPITNLVFMGMGEPLHNWPAVRTALGLFTDHNAYGLSRWKITVSTSGVLPRMASVVQEGRVALALSLHGTRDEERSALIPLNRRWPIAALVGELRRLALEADAITMVQYLLLGGRNDSPAHAAELAALLGDFPCHVNLLTYNPTPGLPFEPPAAKRVAAFKDVLRQSGLRVAHRESRGDDIAGACGQLALR